MARTIRTKIYKFNELSKDAREKAIEKNYDINICDEWWESVFEDAEQIGLKLTEFDIDRPNFCNGEFVLSAAECAANIIKNHGEICETYKTASSFLEEFNPLFAKYFETEEGEDKLMELEDEFLKALLEDYLIMLRHEYEYLTSDEAIKETIEANEYEFTKDGERYPN